MPRQHKRQAQKEIRSIIGKAKAAMYKWVVDLGYEPTDIEIKAWQAGYIAGINQREQN